MKNILGIFKYSDFELKFLKELKIELQGDTLVNLNTGIPFTLIKTNKSYDNEENEKVDCYIFESNGELIECRRLYNKPTKVSIYVKLQSKTCFAGEFINCDMIKLGCECELDDAYKHLIIGCHHELSDDKTIETYVKVEPVLDDGLVCKLNISRFINNKSTISPHEIDITEREIFDDVLNCHGYRSNNTKPIGILNNSRNFEAIIRSAINEECKIDDTIINFYEAYIPFFVDAYTRSMDYTKSMSDGKNKQKK